MSPYGRRALGLHRFPDRHTLWGGEYSTSAVREIPDTEGDDRRGIGLTLEMVSSGQYRVSGYIRGVQARSYWSSLVSEFCLSIDVRYQTSHTARGEPRGQCRRLGIYKTDPVSQNDSVSLTNSLARARHWAEHRTVQEPQQTSLQKTPLSAPNQIEAVGREAKKHWVRGRGVRVRWLTAGVFSYSQNTRNTHRKRQHTKMLRGRAHRERSLPSALSSVPSEHDIAGAWSEMLAGGNIQTKQTTRIPKRHSPDHPWCVHRKKDWCRGVWWRRE